MTTLEERYQKLLKEAEESPHIFGVIFGGSRGKDNAFVTEHSDYDMIVVLSDEAPDEVREELQSLEAPDFDIFPKTMTAFKEHAKWGTKKDWDRYNYAHNRAIIDKTGEIQKIIDEKGNLPKEVQREYLEERMDAYMNSLYRSAKYWRDGLESAALMDASESLPYLMDALYALEGRVKPYNKYFKWELERHPLRLLPWPVDEFTADYMAILTTGDIKIQEKIFQGVKKLFLEQGYNESIDGWKGKYFVG